jgi:hypothetical protein
VPRRCETLSITLKAKSSRGYFPLSSQARLVNLEAPIERLKTFGVNEPHPLSCDWRNGSKIISEIISSCTEGGASTRSLHEFSQPRPVWLPAFLVG